MVNYLLILDISNPFYLLFYYIVRDLISAEMVQLSPYLLNFEKNEVEIMLLE